MKKSKKVIKRKIHKKITKKPIIKPTITAKTTTQPQPSSGIDLKCSRCGYKAVKLGNIKECPLCVICIKCGYTVRRCRCIQGE